MSWKNTHSFAHVRGHDFIHGLEADDCVFDAVEKCALPENRASVERIIPIETREFLQFSENVIHGVHLEEIKEIIKWSYRCKVPYVCKFI